MSRYAVLGLFVLLAAAPREPQSLAARWSFAEGGGTQAGDSSGRNLTGTLAGGAAWTTGRLGYGVSFDGVNDAVTLGSNLPLLQNASVATVACWVRLDSLPASGAFRDLVSISVNSTGPTNTSRLALSLRGDGTAADVFAGGRSTDTEAQQTALADANLGVGTWVHLAAVFDVAGDRIRIYRGGQLLLDQGVAFSAAATPGTAPTNGALGAQDRGDSNFFHGALDEVTIWERALGLAEIQSLAEDGALAARWTLDEGAGASAADASGNAYSGTILGGAAWSSGTQSGALSFDGVDDRVLLPDSNNLLRNVNAATVSAWVKLGEAVPAGAFRELFSLSVASASPTNSSRLAFALRGDGAGADLYAGGRASDTESLKSLVDDGNLLPGQWVHVAAIVDYSRGLITLFKNGGVTASGAAPFIQPRTANTASRNGAIGAQDTGDSNYFRGDLDDLRVYARALDACEIQELAGQGFLSAYWKLDETSGNTAADASGRGFGGTLRNGPAWVPGIRGGALRFDGGNDSVDLGLDRYLLSGVKSATLAAWVKPASLPANGAFQDVLSISVKAATAPTNTSRAVLSLRGDGAAVDIFAGGRSSDAGGMQSFTADTNLGAGTWKHLAAVIDYEHDLIRIYVDGVLAGEGPAPFPETETPWTPSTSAALGSQDAGDSNYFHGDLDDVRVYCHALSAAEIAGLASVTLPDAPLGLTAAPGNAQAGLQWQPVAGSTSYSVKRSTTAGSGYAAVANVGTPFHTDIGLVNGTTYYYKVAALNAAGEGPASAEVSVTPNPAPPAAPLILVPAADALVATGSPSVSGSSGGPGLTIAIFVDGLNAGSTTSGAGGSWAMTPAVPLTDGLHSVTAQATAGTVQSPLSAAVSFRVDTVPPALGASSPADGAQLLDPNVAIGASWSDAGSGVDPASAYLEVDGADVSAAATAGPGGITYGPVLLAPGGHLVVLRVRDRAGNLTSRTWAFTVLDSDNTGPLITSFYPVHEDRIVDNRVGIIVYFEDLESGINVASFRALVDNVDNSSLWTVTQSFAYFTPTVPWTDGEHHYTIEVQNNAGLGQQSWNSQHFRVVEAFAPISGPGGVVESPDSLRPGYRTRIEIPPGALFQPTETGSSFVISIEHRSSPPPLPPGFAQVGPAMSFETPTSFNLPVTLRIPYRVDSIPSGTPEGGLRVLKYLGGWSLVPALPVETAGDRVVTEVLGISSEIYVAVAPLAEARTSEIEITPTEVPADGVRFATVSVVPRDTAGRLLGPGQAVTVSIAGTAVLGPVQDVGNGIYRALVRSSVPGLVSVSATVNGGPLIQEPAPQISFLSLRPDRFEVTLPAQARAGAFVDVGLKALRSNGSVDETFEGLVQIWLTGTSEAINSIYPPSFYVHFDPRHKGVLKLEATVAWTRAGRQSLSAVLVRDPQVRGSGEIDILPAEKVGTLESPTLSAYNATVVVGYTGKNLPMPFVYRVLDSYGNPLSGRQIQLSVEGLGPGGFGAAAFVAGPSETSTYIGYSAQAQSDASGYAVGPYLFLPGFGPDCQVHADLVQEGGNLRISQRVQGGGGSSLLTPPSVTRPAANEVLSVPYAPLEGTAQDGWSVVPVLDDFRAGSALAVTGGTWSATSPLLASGPHTVYAFKKSPVPLPGTGTYVSVRSTLVAFTVNAVVPEGPVILTPSKKTNDVTPRVEGTSGGAAVAVRLFRDGVALLAEVPVVGGIWIVDQAPINNWNIAVSLTAVAVSATGSLSPPSTPVVIEIDTYPPLSPRTLSATPASGFVLLSWPPSESPDALGYNIWRKAASDPDSAYQKINGPTPVVGVRYCDTQVTDGTAYEYRVTAVDDALDERDLP
jgi:hypothetical protein